jgi:uncharacterized Ntn-hydrolase superfamily protein
VALSENTSQHYSWLVVGICDYLYFFPKMTFSIVSSIAQTGELCVATATCYVAVGDRVPKIMPGVGAVAVQASPKPSNRLDILNLMKKGQSPEKAIIKCLDNDAEKGIRQILAIDSSGAAHVFSGNKTINISDSVIGKNFAIAGNMLRNREIIPEMAKTFQKNLDLNLPKRSLLALKAGEDAGGDKRGRLSAALLYSKPNHRIMVLRIDYSNNPLEDLTEALELRYSDEYANISDL